MQLVETCCTCSIVAAVLRIVDSLITMIKTLISTLSNSHMFYIFGVFRSTFRQLSYNQLPELFQEAI
jgi:hypothetical protein